MFSAFFLASALAADIPAGDPIHEALAIQLGQPGLDALSDRVPSLLPLEPIELPYTADSGGAPDWCIGYEYTIDNMKVNLEVLGVSILPTSTELLLDIEMLVTINEPGDDFTLTLDAACLIDEVCVGWIDPFVANATAPLTLAVVGSPGARVLDATVGELAISTPPLGSYMQTGCGIDTIESALNIVGLSIFDLFIGAFVGDLADSIEPTLDEALVAASLAGQFDLGDGVIDYAIEPSAAIHTNQGMEIWMAAAFDAELAACVAPYDPGASVATLAGVPDPAANPGGTELALHASTDMLNQALYAVWRGGGLCMAIGGADAGSLDLGGIALDTTLISLVGGPEFEALFPVAKPIEILLRPRAAPEAAADGANDVALDLIDFDVIFMGELDGRMARAVGVTVQAEIGADLVFDDIRGELGVDLFIDESHITAELAGDALVPGVEDKVAQDFPGVMALLMDSLLPSLVGDTLAFGLPTFEGIGLTSLDVQPSGANQDWLGVYAGLGTPQYVGSNCGGCGGTTTSTGTTTGDCGCSSTGVVPLPWLWVLALVGLRRRRG
jgi:hypothetical protein